MAEIRIRKRIADTYGPGPKNSHFIKLLYQEKVSPLLASRIFGSGGDGIYFCEICYTCFDSSSIARYLSSYLRAAVGFGAA